VTSSPKLRAAVVGVGYLGRFHAQKYKALESEFPVELVAVCDSNFEQAMKVGVELGVPGYRDARDLIGNVDVVTVATVTKSHYEVARSLLQAGIHCNIEKPMTVTVAEAKELVQLASGKKVQLCVGHSERFNPAFTKARELVKNPSVIELIRHAPYKTRGADVSVVHDLMVHDLDLLLALTSQLALIEAKGGRIISPTFDWASALFNFGGTRSAFISVSRVAPQMTRALRIIGPQESVYADLQTGEVQLARYTSPENVLVENFSVGKGDNLLLETRAFLQAVLGQPSEAVTGDQGLRAMEWIHQLMDRIEVQG
jgi:predicted dehydrogenase